MTNTIKCPKCGSPVEVTQVLKNQIQEELTKELEEKHQKELEAAKNQANEKLLAEVKLLKEESQLKEKKLDEARRAELELRKQKNQLEDEKKAFELEKQRQIDKERNLIRQKTITELNEQQRLKDKERDMVIEGLKKSLEDAKRKADQGSQQLQGEVAELDLEGIFRSNFPSDLIEPIAKGTLGADIRQVVRSQRGTYCGKILWESKRTKSWSDSWITKLKDDMRSDKANICAIVTSVIPQEAKKGLGLKDGVWICQPELVVPLALLLRKSLLDAAYQKAVSLNRQTKADQVYLYVTSHEFAQQVESLVDVYLEMKDQIIKERVAFERSWKQREAQVNRLLTGVSGIYGYMQGIAGSALPQIRKLELTSGEE